MRKAERRDLYCQRCDDTVSAIMPWGGWPNSLRGWFVGVAVLALLSPFWGADYCVMIPSAFAYLAAGSVLLRLARQKPICSVCSLDLDPTRAGGTAVRPRDPKRKPKKPQPGVTLTTGG